MKNHKTLPLPGFLGLAILLGANAPGHAANLLAPFEIENANTLPSGVRNPRFKNLFLSIDSKFDSVGIAQPLAKTSNKLVTFGDILDSQARTSAADASSAQAIMNNAGIVASDSPGSTTGDVNVAADVKIPVLAYGVNDRLTLALAVPIYKADIQASTGFVASTKGQAFIDEAARTGTPVEAAKAAGKLNNAVNEKLTSYGYDPIQSDTVSGLGDMKLVAKYRLYSDDRNVIVLKPALTLPTGIAPNPDKAVDVPTGDGQWDTAAGLVWDYQLYSDIRVNTWGVYTAQMPDSIEKRIPERAGDAITPDKEIVSRNLGDQLGAGTGLTFGSLTRGFSLGVGYSYQYMNQDSYEGTRFAQERYRYLEDLNPAQDLHAATLMAGFATIDYFKEKSFFYPFQAFLAYSRILGGRNSNAADVFAAEMVMFF